MNIKEHWKEILDELEAIAEATDADEIDRLVSKIREADRVFSAGAGRARLMISGFAMRLMQADIESYLVGEVVTPSIRKGDLLIIASGSGRTGSMLAIAGECRKIGADLALITTSKDSPIAAMSDCTVVIPTSTSKLEEGNGETLQPGADAFEQSLHLLLDAIATCLLPGDTVSEKNLTLMRNHANLE